LSPPRAVLRVSTRKLCPFTAFNKAQATAMTAAAARYGHFVGKRAIVAR